MLLALTTWAHNNATYENKHWPGTQPALRTIFKCLLGRPLSGSFRRWLSGTVLSRLLRLFLGHFQGSQLGLIETGVGCTGIDDVWNRLEFGDYVLRRCAGGDRSDSGDWVVAIMGEICRYTWSKTRKTCLVIVRSWKVLQL